MENSNSLPFEAQNFSDQLKEVIHMSSSATESTKPLPNGHIVIWHDPNIYSPQTTRYVNALKIITDVQLFTEWKEASLYLKQNQVSFCQVITSETNGELFVKEIYDMQTISSIYVFCSDTASDETWVKQCSTTICVENDFACLLEKIAQTMRIWQRISSSLMGGQASYAPSSDYKKEDLGPLGSETQKDQEEIKKSLDYPLLEEHKASDNQEEIIIMSDIDQIVKQFVKESTIIWHDPNVHSLDNIDYINELKTICDVQAFTDWKEACKYLKVTQASYCQVIICEANAELLVKDIYGLKNVPSIFLFCSGIDISPAWIHQYISKVTCVGTNFASLRDKIKQTNEKMNKKSSSLRLDLPSFAPIFDNTDQSEVSYRYFYLQGLINFTNRSQAKRDFLALAKALYGTSQHHYISDFENKYDQYDMKAILNWYTKESFVNKLVNNCLRLTTPDSIQYCRLVLRDLETAIKEKYRKQSHTYSGLLYRGAYMSNEEWTRLKQNIGQEIEMYGFLSTTKDKNVAVSFSQEDMHKKAFVTIIVPNIPEKGEQGFAEMGEYTDFVEENEVLFNVRSRFTVLEATTEEIEEKTEMRHLVLLYGAQAMRRFIKLNNPVIEIEISNNQEAKCRVCDRRINLTDEAMVAIDVCKTNEYVCVDCMQKRQTRGSHPLLCISPAANGLSRLSEKGVKLQIEGTAMPYQKNLKISFYGYKCQICQQARLSCSYKCISCQDDRITYCDTCFLAQRRSKCTEEGHLVILEEYPFSLWAEKMSDKELQHLKYQEELFSNSINYFQQANIFSYTHNYNKVVEYYRKYIERGDVTNNMQVLNSFNNLAFAYYSLGEYQKAVLYLTIALDTTIALFGDKHPDTVTSYNNLAEAYRSLGEYQKALEYLTTGLEARKAMFGDKHPDTATSYSNLALAYHSLGEYQKAVEYFTIALDTRIAVLGDKHPHTAISYNNLAETYRSLGEHQKALEYLTITLDTNIAVFGEKHPDTAASYNNLAIAYSNLGEYEKALEYTTIALKTTKAMFGDKHPKTATSYSNLASIYFSLGEHQKAIEHHTIALEALKAVFGDKHPQTATSYNNLALAYKSLGENQKALEYYTIAVETMKTVLGDKHPQTAISCSNLALEYYCLGEYQKAVEYFTIALDTRIAVFGNKHSDTLFSYYSLAEAYEGLGEFQKALEYRTIIHEATKIVFDDEYPDTDT